MFSGDGMDKNFMSAREAADILGVTSRTVTNAVQEGRLSAEKVGSTFVILKDEKFASFKPRPSRWDKVRETARKD